MGGLKDFLIRFDRSTRVFFPGDVVSGQLVLNLTDTKKFKKIKVELVGKGEVHWTEQRSDQNGVQTINYVNNEDYVEYEVNVHQVEKSYVK